MKKIKKARSMAAVLAVMALTAGSTMAADLTSKGSASIGDYPLADVSVTATGEDVAASLDGQTLKNVTIDGYATSEDLSNVAIQANTALNGMTENAKNIGDLQTQVEKNTIDIGGLQSTVADHQTQINNAAGMADTAYNGMTQNTQDINNLDNQINGKDG